MKVFAIIGMAVVVGALGAYLVYRENETHTSYKTHKSYQSHQSDTPTTTNTDAAEVFKRAFWKRPTEDDHILHAERREWADEDGVARWQWFIAVDPSEQLASYLHGENPFSMVAPEGEAVMPSEPRPAWFPETAEGYTVRQSRDGQMLFLTDAKTGRLYASSQGRGFARPVGVSPPSAPTSRSPAVPGRLPDMPPPVPEER